MVDERTVGALLRLLRRTDLDPVARCRLLGALSFELAGEGDPRAAESAREAVALARDLPDPALLALALSAEAWEASWDHEPERRARLAEEIGGIGRAQDLVAYRWCAEHIAATAAAADNDLHALRGHVERGLELARAYQMPEPLSVGPCAQAMLAHVAGHFDQAERRYAEACARTSTSRSSRPCARWRSWRWAGGGRPRSCTPPCSRSAASSPARPAPRWRCGRSRTPSPSWRGSRPARGRRRASRGGGRRRRAWESPRWEVEARAAMGAATSQVS
jgi:hypothetical protein